MQCAKPHTLPEDLAVLSRSERLLSEPSRWYSCLDSSIQYLLVLQQSDVADKHRLTEPKYCKYATANDLTVGKRDDLDKLTDILHIFPLHYEYIFIYMNYNYILYYI